MKIPLISVTVSIVVDNDFDVTLGGLAIPAARSTGSSGKTCLLRSQPVHATG